MNRSPIRRLASVLSWVAAFAFLLVFTACGGKHGTLTLSIVVSPTDDPFRDATQVRFTVIDSAHVTTVPVSGGSFQYKVSQKPDAGKSGIVTVEALNGAGQVIARGVSPTITVTTTDQALAIWVGRVGAVQTAPVNMAVVQTMTDASGNQNQVLAALPLRDVAVANVNGLGVFFAGGRSTDGKTLANSAVYDVYTQTVIPTANMTTARAGGVVAPITGVKVAVYGGASSDGAGTTGGPADSLELFDPSVSIGTWAALPHDTFTGRSFAAGTLLGNGDTLVSGGADGNGAPLATAGLINPDGAVRLTLVSSPMAAARLYHAVAPAHYPDGDGALLFGGLGAAGGPVAERLVGQTFSAYDVGALDNRLHATATQMPSGDILVLGGETAAGPQASGFIIKPTLPSATVTPLPNALSVPRTRHSATLTGNVLVVCGGLTQTADMSPATLKTDAAMKSCDVLDAKTYGIAAANLPLATPRYDIAAAALETGVVVLGCGVDTTGGPSAAIELYTP